MALVLALQSALTGGQQFDTGPKASLALDLGLQLALELVLEKVDTTFQVQARQVAMYKGHQLLLAGQVWRLARILQILVQQPGVQDGGEGPEDRKAGSRVRTLVFAPHTASYGTSTGGSAPLPGLAHPDTSRIPNPLWLPVRIRSGHQAGDSVIGCSR